MKIPMHTLDNLTPSLIVTSSETEHEPLTNNTLFGEYIVGNCSTKYNCSTHYNSCAEAIF